MHLQKFCLGLCFFLLGCGFEVSNSNAPSVAFEKGDMAPAFVGLEWLELPQLLFLKEGGRVTREETRELISSGTSLESLRGSVVVLNFWSYECGFCREVVNWLQEWQVAYPELRIIGIHTPEYSYERKKENVTDWVKKLNITYSVAMDNKKKTWKAYQNKYRPALYLIDREGRLQYLTYGTSKKQETREMIENLLREGE